MSLRRDILEKYKKQFRQYHEMTIQTSCMAWGLEVPDEWLPIIDAMCAAVDELELPIEWTQIKEKYGGLRAYWDETRRLSESQFEAMSLIERRAELLVWAFEEMEEVRHETVV